MFGPKVALLGGNVIVLEKGGISWGECVLFGSQRCTLGEKAAFLGESVLVWGESVIVRSVV